MAFSEIKIETPDGLANGRLFTPDTGMKAPNCGVIVYMDAFGLRPAMDTIAQNIANAGYLTLVPDLFYREAPYGPFDADAFKDEEKAAALRRIMGATTQAMTVSDTRFFLDVFASHDVERVGTVGYCMGGARALNAAAHYPDQIVAAASFHGGNLASDAEDSPHRAAARIKAKLYIGVAGVDRSFPPEQSARLAEALRVAEVDHIIENYVGMAHGWAVSDHSVHDAEGAGRHWRRLLTFFGETL
jgi:carboxymethylenebutenolidase